MSRTLRAWFAAAIGFGVGQQVFVVLRNPFLRELGVNHITIAVVQATGSAAGVVAGLLGLRWLKRIGIGRALVASATANAIGFVVQTFAARAPWFVLGSAIAGAGIQGLTMAAGPLVQRHSAREHQPTNFAFSSVLLQSVPGAVGAWVGGQVQALVSIARGGSAAFGFRTALAVGALSVAASAAVLLLLLPRDDCPRPESPRRAWDVNRPRTGARLAWSLLAPDAFFAFGTAVSVPYLQLYFRAQFAVGAVALGRLYASALAIGTVAALLAARLASRGSPWRLAIAAQLAMLPLFGELAFPTSFGVAVGAFVLRHVAMTVAAPMLSSFYFRSVPPHDVERFAAWRMIVQSGAWTGGTLVAGPLMEHPEIGFRGCFVTTIVATAVAIVWGAVRFPKIALNATEGHRGPRVR